ncbi:MAG TPA: sugar transferase [Burkholderiaceae bacterium]|jgi:lipopolysaccharide/colanic/teichoic acid biosynthesis glycosyltransferase|nr:sugar transferase [Burkholderiaceae bacterium]
MAKRLFDLVGALAGLLLFGLPLVAIALWIRLDSPGPVLFRQERVGRHGRSFRIHKFRTMRVDAPARGLPLTVGADARITRAGAVLRAHRLDELPQLIDVLAGSMSLVGPRPDVPVYVAQWPPALRERILAVRPGMTDPASLEFRDEASLLAASPDPEREYVEVILPRKLARSADYAERASVWTDLAVIGRSVGVLVAR